MKLKQKIEFVIILEIFFIVITIFICVLNYQIIPSNVNLEDYNNPNLKNANYWDLTGSPIFIDDSNSNYNWSKTAFENDWCTGSGTFNDPYLIENVTINGLDSGSCIKISNSSVFFKISNCTVYNSQAGTYPNGQAGVNLLNVTNGYLVDNNCSNNLGEGIRLWECTYNNLTGNIVNNNGKSGIQIWYSDHNNLSNNKAKNNNFDGYRLSTSHNNTLLSNYASLNTYGMEVSTCDYNYIFNNSIVYNTLDGVYIYNSLENNFLSNNFSNNARFGIYLAFSDGNNFSFNSIL